MNRAPKFLLASLLLVPCALPAVAQQPLDWVPRGMDEFSRTAAFHTDFTFDRTMLQLASGMMDNGDQDVQHAIAKLDGISVHSYRYAAPGMYNPQHLDRVREQYRAAGWKHMVSAESHGVYNNTGRTDLWINFQHGDVTGMVLLFATNQNLNLIALSGDVSPLDLLHLRGHFGIPKFEGDRFVPAGDKGRARRYPSAPPATPAYPANPQPPSYPEAAQPSYGPPPSSYPEPSSQAPASSYPATPESSYPAQAPSAEPPAKPSPYGEALPAPPSEPPPAPQPWR